MRASIPALSLCMLWSACISTLPAQPQLAGGRQAVVSELVLSNQQGKCLKVRTTAPANQRGAAFDVTRVLLKGLHPKR